MHYKEFNRDKVLETCLSLFWNNGFNSCSIYEIVKKTGVNRFSLYESGPATMF
ncbi:MAG: TetR/AcrR family transcriptional regulator [Chitinophagaceae bacterium]